MVKYNNEMRGVLFVEQNRKNERSPVMTGTLTVSGVELRLAAWDAATTADGKKYYFVKVEYKQGSEFVLAKIAPSKIIAKEATAPAEIYSEPVEVSVAKEGGESLPF